ncbi:MAG: hypothetical protein R3C30_01560 [Hyphomonadaceae bacterium]
MKQGRPEVRTNGIAAFVAFFVLVLATSASAQTTWQYRGVTFTPRAGWCGAEGVDAGGVTSFVMRSCDGQWPQLSTAPMFPAGSPVAQMSVEEITSRLMAHSASPSEHERVAEIGRRISPQCVMANYATDGNQMPGIRTIGVLATFQCPQMVAYNNITVVVRGRDGAIWGIAADFGAMPITPDDIAQMRGLIAAIGQQ